MRISALFAVFGVVLSQNSTETTTAAADTDSTTAASTTKSTTLTTKSTTPTTKSTTPAEPVTNTTAPSAETTTPTPTDETTAPIEPTPKPTPPKPSVANWVVSDSNGDICIMANFSTILYEDVGNETTSYQIPQNETSVNQTESSCDPLIMQLDFPDGNIRLTFDYQTDIKGGRNVTTWNIAKIDVTRDSNLFIYLFIYVQIAIIHSQCGRI
jgi:hypothetical protein